MKTKVLINGFGRIGRAFFRQSLCCDSLEVIGINDCNASMEQLIYLIKYDTVLGVLPFRIEYVSSSLLRISQNGALRDIRVGYYKNPADIDFMQEDVIVVDATGEKKNYQKYSHAPNKVIFTYMLDELTEPLIFGFNDNNEGFKADKYISLGICDIAAIAPIVKIMRKWKPLNICISTIHPVLSYQEVLDGFTSKSEIQLTRAYSSSIIPKETSADKIAKELFPDYANKMYISTVRAPILEVSFAQFSVALEHKITVEEFLSGIRSSIKTIGRINNENLVSTDLKFDTFSYVLNQRSINVLDNGIYFNVWYNNEWGYASRIIDAIKFTITRT